MVEHRGFVERVEVFPDVTPDDEAGLWGHYETACAKCGRPIQVVVPVRAVERGVIDLQAMHCFPCDFPRHATYLN